MNSAADAFGCASPAAYVVPEHPATGAASSSPAATDTTGAGATPTATGAASPTATDTTGTGTAANTASPTATATGTGTAAPTATGTATATATPSSTTSATITATPCASASASASASGTATTTTTNVNCDIIVPANPLSAQGLATPYQLTGQNGMSPQQSGCTMANATALGAFVQATILDTQTGKLYVYDPLVITQGTTPAAAPTVPTLPARYVATVDIGFNGTDLHQVGATPNALRQGNCVGGQGGADFGQVSFCNGPTFFAWANALERAGKLTVPSAGTSAKITASGGQLGTGQACPTTRNFEMTDQDPSDNVTSLYLLDPATGQTAQDTAANAGNMPGAETLANGSDNALLADFLDPTLGCTPFEAPDLGNNNQPASSMALNELSAAKNQPAVPALVPENDEMVLDGGGNADVTKTNLYRSEVGQPAVSNANNQFDSPAMYCQNLLNIQVPFLTANQAVLSSGQTPVPAVGNNLFTFLANRLSMSFANLGCQSYGLTNPVNVTVDGNGVATAATFNGSTQTATTGTGTTGMKTPPWNHRRGRQHHQYMDPSGE